MIINGYDKIAAMQGMQDKKSIKTDGAFGEFEALLSMLMNQGPNGLQMDLAMPQGDMLLNILSGTGGDMDTPLNGLNLLMQKSLMGRGLNLEGLSRNKITGFEAMLESLNMGKLFEGSVPGEMILQDGTKGQITLEDIEKMLVTQMSGDTKAMANGNPELKIDTVMTDNQAMEKISGMPVEPGEGNVQPSDNVSVESSKVEDTGPNVYVRPEIIRLIKNEADSKNVQGTAVDGNTEGAATQKSDNLMSEVDDVAAGDFKSAEVKKVPDDLVADVGSDNKEAGANSTAKHAAKVMDEKPVNTKISKVSDKAAGKNSDGALGDIPDKTSDKAASKESHVFQNIAVVKDDGELKNASGQANVKQPMPMSKDDVMNQIYDRVKFAVSKGTPEIHVSLKPDELGQVAIKLVMDKGIMTARIVVENSQVKSLIESNLPEMKEQLKSQNLDVSEFSVSVGLEQGSFENNREFLHDRWMHNMKMASKARMNTLDTVDGIKLTRNQEYKGGLNALV